MTATISPRKLDRVCQSVSAEFGVPVSLLKARDRSSRVSRARWAAWLILNHIGHPKNQIADCFGYDHTTVISGIRRARALGKLYLEKVNAAAAVLGVSDLIEGMSPPPPPPKTPRPMVFGRIALEEHSVAESVQTYEPPPRTTPQAKMAQWQKTQEWRAREGYGE